MLSPAQNARHLLDARLTVNYAGKPPVLRDVQIQIQSGEILGLVGQSGSGKSTLAMALLGLLEKKKTDVNGQILFQGSDLLKLSERGMRGLRGHGISLVLQSPLSSLNPALRIRTQMNEAWRAHAQGSKESCASAVRSALESVSLPSAEEFQRKYPSQMSVGQAQRVLIAMAILHRPALLIADEATSALDVITQSEILKLFRELNRTFGMAIFYISHDLPSVAEICDRIVILNQGEIVESGPVAQIFSQPQHEYTQRLMAALPRFLNRTPKTSAAATAAR